MNRATLLAASLIAATVAVGIWAYAVLPPDARIAVHFSASGDPDGFMPKGPGLAVLPAIGAVIVSILALATRPNRRDSGLAASAGVVGVVLIGVAAMFLVSEAAIAKRAMDPTFDVIRWLFVAIGILFLVTGNLLGKVRHNYFIGVRTPWTMRDKRVWDKTQRFTGRLMVLAGCALAGVAALSADHRLLIETLIVCAVGPGLAGVVYSRAIYQPASQG
jgi:uncharacterized membrane protein